MSRALRSSPPVSLLLLEWQETGDERKLEAISAAIAPLAEQVARHVLRSAGIADPGAIDEVMSKVFDHLRRLPGPRAGERGVAVFRPSPVGDPPQDGVFSEHGVFSQHSAVGEQSAVGENGAVSANRGVSGDGESSSSGDAGVAFVRWLAKERARDIVRATLRRARHTRLFSQLAPEDAGLVRSLEERIPSAGERLGDALRHAIESLDGRPRLVVELLLAGESQAAIARLMGVCEGTVSRIRAKAISDLRSLIEEAADAGPGRRSPK